MLSVKKETNIFSFYLFFSSVFLAIDFFFTRFDTFVLLYFFSHVFFLGFFLLHLVYLFLNPNSHAIIPLILTALLLFGLAFNMGAGSLYGVLIAEVCKRRRRKKRAK